MQIAVSPCSSRDCLISHANGELSMSSHTQAAPFALIERRLPVTRRSRVMLDSDLADRDDVVTGHLNKAVRRNLARCPSDFMFQLSNQELIDLRFQIGISSSAHGGQRYRPFAFTEQGIAM